MKLTAHIMIACMKAPLHAGDQDTDQKAIAWSDRKEAHANFEAVQ